MALSSGLALVGRRSGSLARTWRLLAFGPNAQRQAAAVVLSAEPAGLLRPIVVVNTASCGGKFCHLRSIHSSIVLQEDVKVPSMGDSITEGSIAAVLKQAGDSVSEDEPILQIETDKVTVDVRAPHTGVLEKLLVKENDTVSVGQVVALLKAGDKPSKSKESEPRQEAEPKNSKQPPAESKPPTGESAAPTAKQESAAAGDTAHVPPPRTPSIHFPPRVTEDGRRVSELPAAEAKTYLEQHAQRTQQPPSSDTAPPAGAAQKQTQPQPTSRQVFRVTEPGTKLSASRVLSAKEMEMIELGGAEP